MPTKISSPSLNALFGHPGLPIPPDSSMADLAEHDSESLRLLGKISTGVAHDLRGVLSAVSLHVQMLQRANDREFTQERNGSNNLERIANKLRFGLEFLDRIHHFGRAHSAIRAEIVSLNEIASAACELAMTYVPADRTRRRIIHSLRARNFVVGHRGDLISAVMNLVLGAVDDLPSTAEISVSTAGSLDESWVTVAATDVGEERIPFRSAASARDRTRRARGIAEIADCMRVHGGQLTLDASRPLGAAVTLRFPRAELE